MKVLTGLFRAARKRLLTTDTDMGMFRDKINELVDQKDSLSDDEVTKRVDELVGFTDDLPDGDDKAKLGRFLEDFRSVKEQDAAVAKEAGSAVADLFEKLDKEAMQDAPLVEGAAPETEAPGEVSTEVIAEETEAPAEDADPEAEEIPAEEEVVETEEEAEDADPDPEYSLEEIYQFIKKRMAEDAEAGAEETEEEIPEETGDDAEEVQEEEEEVVTDHAPRIPVAITKDHTNKGSLAAMFENVKRGTR